MENWKFEHENVQYSTVQQVNFNKMLDKIKPPSEDCNVVFMTIKLKIVVNINKTKKQTINSRVCLNYTHLVINKFILVIIKNNFLNLQQFMNLLNQLQLNY